MVKIKTIVPHGGKLISRILSKSESDRMLGKKYKCIRVCRDIILDLQKIAIGAYSPLTGFMKKDELTSVLNGMRLATGDVWTIPIFFPIDDLAAGTLSRNEKVMICEENGKKIGVLKIEEIYSFDKLEWAGKVFGTQSTEHPGVNRLLGMHSKFIGGPVWMIDNPDAEFEKFNKTPMQTREIIEKRGWRTVTGFQTRNVPHRAHEYLQKIALSVTDGLLIHPIIGWKKQGDFNPEVIIEAYNTLIDKYYPKGKVIFSGLDTAMRYAGPREAVFHAIIRKNYGCTHFIVGRDHAGVGGFYDKYAAHKIFEKLPDIGIIPMKLSGPFYCKKCGEITTEKLCPHGESARENISGTAVRRMVSNRIALPETFVRKEINDLLVKYGPGSFI